MTNSMPPPDEEHADDIVLATIYEAPTPSPKQFLPWHLPRKQYVRHHQWCEQIGRLLDEYQLADGTLKYLGLPGVDLLDLRYFHSQICETRGVNLRFLGFNSSAMPTSKAHTELNISLDEVRRLARVDPMSEVIRDNFALVAKENSIACRKARELGPYDVINLDLCDGFGAQPPDAIDHTYYDAVSSLFALQARSKNPWLFFLTTRADRPNIDAQVLQTLLGKYIDNLATCVQFRDASLEKFAIETKEALLAAAETPEGILPVFLTGLCKWFLGLALAHQPPISVELCSVVGYRVNQGATQEDLISLALRFTPTFVPPGDPLGLANKPAAAPDECVLSTRVLKRVAKRVDADKKLSDDHALKQTMIDATASLLEIARYDVEAYKTWLTVEIA
jgi:hypothetical protein